jgi:cysteine-rich repeat protein
VCSQAEFSIVNGKCQTVCGDGLLASNEQCDDKNPVNGDGCSSICKIEPFFTCSGQPSTCAYNGPAVCGNRRIEAGETCDDGNLINGDGCSSKCQIESLPSPTNSTTNNINRGLSVVGNISTNTNNVFLSLKTDKTYSFVNEDEKKNFIKARFPDSKLVPTVYCTLNETAANVFDCLIIYSSGVPNQQYKIEFSYNYGGDSGFLSVDIKPIASGIRSRK